LHAALFDFFRRRSPELSARLHDEMNLKPFTVAMLALPPVASRGKNRIVLREGDRAAWRVTALNEIVLRVLLDAEFGEELRVGDLRFAVERVSADSDKRPDVGFVDEEELVAQCLSVSRVEEVSFEFLSPVSFRSYDMDYPYPLPELVFASLADKWNAAGMPGSVDRDRIREIAATLPAIAWKGETKRLFFGRGHGVIGFQGAFTYRTARLDAEDQRVLLLLAQFANFSGVGRLTGQGLGQTRTKYR
jgi:CRISPR-associated endoribonuclease Cas6